MADKFNPPIIDDVLEELEEVEVVRKPPKKEPVIEDTLIIDEATPPPAKRYDIKRNGKELVKTDTDYVYRYLDGSGFAYRLYHKETKTDTFVMYDPDTKGQTDKNGKKMKPRPFRKIIRFDTNHDEATKHGHYFVLPTDERGYLNASRYFGKKKQIIALQDSYAEAMEQFGLERGRSKEETRANHQSLNEWHKQGEERLLAEIVKIEKEKAVIEQVKNRVFADDRAVPQKSRVIGDELFDILE